MSKNTMKEVLQLRLSETELNRYNQLAILKGKNISQLIRDTMTEEISRSLSSDSDYEDISTWKLKESKPFITMKFETLNFDKDKADELFVEYITKASKETNKERKYLYRIIAEFSYQLSKLKEV